MALAAQPPAAQDRIELVRELAIGEHPASPEYEFAALGPAVVSRGGTVYVVVAEGPTTQQIRAFDQSGRFRRLVGRMGAGPGEYRYVEAIALVGDSLLVVMDPMNARVTVFDTAATYRRSWSVPGVMLGQSSKAFAAFADGTIAVRIRLTRLPSGFTGNLPMVFVRHRTTGDIVDSIPAPDLFIGGAVLVVRNLGRRFPFTNQHVFTPLQRGGIATASATRYQVDIALATGPRFTARREVPAIPLDGREREEWQALLDRMPAGHRPILPRRKPFIRDLYSDDEGRIWVEVYTQAVHREPEPSTRPQALPSLTYWEPNVYDVFDERGRFLGRVELRPFSRLAAVAGSRIWVSEETEHGGSMLVRYQLTGIRRR